MQYLDSNIFATIYSEKEFSQIEDILISENPELFLAYEISLFQSPVSIKNITIARRLSEYLIVENGELSIPAVVKAIETLSKNLYALGSFQYKEAPFREHLLFILNTIKNSVELKQTIKRIFLPSQPSIHEIIRDTLDLDDNITLTPAHAKRAVLSALFTYPKQHNGETLTSSLAILLQKEYPEKVLQDLEQLLSFNRLSRSIDDIDIEIPFNISNFYGELHDPILISDLGSDPLKSLSKSPGLMLAFAKLDLLQLNEAVFENHYKLLSHPTLSNKLLDGSLTITADYVLRSTLEHIYEIDKNTIHITLISEGLSNTGSNAAKKTALFLEAYNKAKRIFLRGSQNRLLKSWENTLVTLSSYNNNNLKNQIFTSLGWDSNEPNSIVSLIHDLSQNIIADKTQNIRNYEEKYEELQGQIAFLESRIRNPQNNQESQILIMDHHRFKQELNETLQEWRSEQEKLKKLAHLPQTLLHFYEKQLNLYFHGIYDGEVNLDANIIKESVATFRIFYTHGRKHSSTWSPIYSLNEYFRFLSDFFHVTEIDLLSLSEMSNIEKEVSSILRQISSSLHSESFHLASILRVLNTYNIEPPTNLLANLHLLPILPWTFIIEGSMEQLLQNYFGNTNPVTFTNKLPETFYELVAFCSDTIKDLPSPVKVHIEASNALIMMSPTHAFLTYPSHPLFKDCWDNTWYSFTWIRDQWMNSQIDFLSSTILDKPSIFLFINTFCEHARLSKLNQDMVLYFQDLSLSITELFDKAEHFLKLQNFEPDRFNHYNNLLLKLIYNNLPYTQEQQLPTIINQISEYLGIKSRINYQKYETFLNESVLKHSLISANELRHLYLALLLKEERTLYSDENQYVRLAAAMRHLQLSFPAPLLLGDSNYPFKYIGFIVHPGTRDIDLWYFNYAGYHGNPIPNSYELLQNNWSFLTNPTDFGMPPPPGFRSNLPKQFFS